MLIFSEKKESTIRRDAMAAIAVMASLWLLAISFTAGAANREGSDTVPVHPVDELTVSILTCSPGSEIYELCGHAALRIRDSKSDVVWNYGVFDFNEPNFVYRFVKGESDYMLAGAFFNDFMYQYVNRGSRVVEQVLNLNAEEKLRLAQRLWEESLPQNRTYRYNYVKDNCATRILDRIEETADAKLIYPDTLYFPTFRREMMNYHGNYPWYQFGIDLALGEDLDLPLNGREDMFVPMVMNKKLESTFLSDGRKLVSSENVIFEGSNDVVLPPTPWWRTPAFLFWLIFSAVAVMAVSRVKSRAAWKTVYAVWFTLIAAAGAVVTFLVFVSSHEATSPNMFIFWMNPLQIIVPIAVLFSRLRKIGIAIAVWNTIILLWQSTAILFSGRGAQPAFLPIMLTTLLLSAMYAYSAYKEKKGKKLRNSK